MKPKLLTTLTAALLALSAWANGTEINGIYYVLYSSTKTASVTYTGTGTFSYNPSSTAYTGSITIPATVTYGGTTYSVTSIGGRAFYNCSGLTSINIPNSVTNIGNDAFRDCSSLTSINIPNSVTSIGSSAFEYCIGLTSITIPNSVTSIGVCAFQDCRGLTSITIPNSVTCIGNWAFDGCRGLTSITIPNSVTSIGDWAFNGCTSLTSINIPNSVTSIGSRTFSDCTSLTSINIPNSVTIIGGYAFAWCSGLTSIKVEEGNTKYDSRDNCNAIIETATNTLIAGCKATTIPNSVTSIAASAFNDCTGLTSITIPNSVTSIGKNAFYGCTGLTSITIPNSVTTIGNDAFRGCTGLTSIKVETGNTKYDSRDNCNAIIETASNTLIRGCKATSIPASVTSIGDLAFFVCTSLTSIEIPNSVTSIGSGAFEYCKGLTSINIPNSVTSIGDLAFFECTGLTSINIPNSVTTIGDNAFACCSSLRRITLSWDDPTNCTYGSNILYRVPTSATLYVPAGTKALYENTEPWSSFENIVERGKSVITLSNTMGTYCDASGLDFSSVEGLEAYTATGYADGEVTLTRVNYVPANTGIVLRGTAGVYEVPQQKVNAYLMNLLKGTTSPITLNQTEGDMTNYILANGSKGIGFYKVASGGGTLAANKAYLQLPSNLSATRPMMLRFEDEDGQTTDIQYLYTSSDDETAPAIFDLQGRRVSGTMQQSGIYIVGGKKVMAK